MVNISTSHFPNLVFGRIIDFPIRAIAAFYIFPRRGGANIFHRVSERGGDNFRSLAEYFLSLPQDVNNVTSFKHGCRGRQVRA